MKHARSSLLRRIVMWTAAVALVVSVAAWVVSLFCVSWGAEGTDVPGSVGLHLGLLRGGLWVHNMYMVEGSGWHAHGLDWPMWWFDREYGVVWTQRDDDGTLWWSVFIPLWMPALGAATMLTVIWYKRRTRRARALAGHCPTCGYDLTGIAGPCPECGREQEREA